MLNYLPLKVVATTQWFLYIHCLFSSYLPLQVAFKIMYTLLIISLSTLTQNFELSTTQSGSYHLVIFHPPPVQ